jgi:hypothetical protein
MTTPAPAGTPSERSPRSLAWHWLNPRHTRFWLIALLLLYTLGGFFAVPALVKRLAVAAILDGAGREATIERVRFNPYVLSMEVEGFAVRDTDGARLAGFERLFANFQLSSLFRWAWTFREISVDGPYHLIERFAPGDSRLTRLLADIEARTEARIEVPTATEEPGGLPRLLVHELTLDDGRLRFLDQVPAEPVALELGPVTVSVRDFNTLPDRLGQLSVHSVMPNDSVADWQGSLGLGPLQSEGSLSLEGTYPEQLTTYLKATLPLQSVEADFAASTRYQLEERADGTLAVELDGLESRLANVAVTGLTPATRFIAFRSLALSGGTLRYPENTLQLSSVRLSGAEFETWLDEAGRFNLLQLADAAMPVAEPPTEPVAAEPPEPATEAATQALGGAAWRLGLDAFVLEDGRVGFADHSIQPRAELQLQGLELSARDISNEDDAAFPVSLAGGIGGGSRFAFEGRVTALPALSASGTASAGAIPLALAQPWVQQQLNLGIEGGVLASAVDLTLRPDKTVSAAGELSITGLLVNDSRDDQPLVGWERLDVERFEVDTTARTLSTSRLIFQQPLGRVVIHEDTSTNLARLVREDAVDAAPGEEPAEGAPGTAAEDPGGEATAEDAPGYAFVIGGVAVNDGALDFSDLSLPLPFAARIGELGGTISTLDSSSGEPANIELEGQVDDYGLARIHGDLNLMDPLRATDITMEFRNLLMSNLSPYSVQFAGREIAEGKLDLDLLYRIENGRMTGQNDIVMSDLVLGAKVEHPGAASLPLGLAVALLKDANGVIDIELPVEGDVNDPQFRIGGVIWQAFVGLVTKIVSAPFRLLGRLVGADSEDLGQFRFLAGRADLTPPEREKIELLQKALRERPELAIEVSGGYVSAVDVPALQLGRLRDAVLRRAGVAATVEGEEIRLLDDRLHATLEAIFAERFPETPLDTLKAAHTVSPADDPEGEPVLDGLAYAAALRDRLLASEPIGQAELDALANARAAAIHEAFLAGDEFAAGRITVIAPSEAATEGADWVVMELGLAVP